MRVEWMSVAKWLMSTICSGCVATVLNISASNAARNQDNRHAAALAAIQVAVGLESYANSCAELVDDFDVSSSHERKLLVKHLPSLPEFAELSGFDFGADRAAGDFAV